MAFFERTAATASGGSTISRLYPVYDESAAGTLQAVLNANGEVVSRNASQGAYGEDPYELGGSAVDRIAMKAEKDADGNLVSVDVAIRTTERIAEATLAGGVRLAVLDTTGAVLTSTSVTPTLSDDWTANWHLTADDWNALAVGDPNSPLAARRSSLSIAVTSTLRASDWSADLPILPAPDWAIASRPVYASAALPVEARESLTTLGTWLDGIAASSTDTRIVYEVGSLGALGTLGGVEPRNDPAKLLVSAPFQAQPFLEPLTGQDYVRNRWYDPGTGSWLSPDPLGYRDSSNLYAFAGGDPVNGRDPTGEYQADFHYGITMFLAIRAGFRPRVARIIADYTESPDQNPATEPISTTVEYLAQKTLVVAESVAAWADRVRGWKSKAKQHDAISTAVQNRRRHEAAAIRQLHFPRSDSDPSIVLPMSREATAFVRRGIAMRSLPIFATGLHPLQDSFSHAFGPSIDDFSGHSLASGGFWSKDADIPFESPDIAKAAAFETYQKLKAFAKARPDLVLKAPAPWLSVSRELDGFLGLVFPDEKKKWFCKRGVMLPADYWKDVTVMPTADRMTHSSQGLHLTASAATH